MNERYFTIEIAYLRVDLVSGLTFVKSLSWNVSL